MFENLISGQLLSEEGELSRYIFRLDLTKGPLVRTLLVQERDTDLWFLTKIWKKEVARAHGDSVRQEAESLQLVCNERVPEFKDLVETESHIVLLQSYIEGTDLEAEISTASEGQPEGVVREFLLQMLTILDCVHSAKIVHRDVKPANILIGADGSYFLVGFSSATFEIMARHILLTSLRTSEFAPPEALAHGRMDSKGDLYCLGKVALMLLIPCFVSIDPLQLDLAFWRDYLPEQTSISQSFGSVIDGLIQFDPNRRFRSAKEALVALEDKDFAGIANLHNTLNGLFTGPVQSSTPLHGSSINIHHGEIMTMRWTLDGTRLVTGSFDGALGIISSDGSFCHIPQNEDEIASVTSIAVAQDLLLSTHKNKSIRLWSLEPRELPRMLSQSELSTSQHAAMAAFNISSAPDQVFLATGGPRPAIEHIIRDGSGGKSLWDLSSFVGCAPGTRPFWNVQPSVVFVAPDQECNILALSQSGDLVIWTTAGKRVLSSLVLNANSFEVVCAALSPSRDLLAVGGAWQYETAFGSKVKSRGVAFLDLRSTHLRKFETKALPLALCFDAHGQTLYLTEDRQKSGSIIDLGLGTYQSEAFAVGKSRCLAIHPSNSRIAFGQATGEVRFFDLPGP